MVLTYLPQYEYLLQSPCPCHGSQHPSVLVNCVDPSPYTPETQTIPLPLETTPPTTTETRHIQLEDGIFPLNILQGPPTNRRHAEVLHSIVLTLPIHIHTPVAHIGTVVHGNSHNTPGQMTNALELIYFLRAILWQPVNLQTGYNLTVSDRMRTEVERAFQQRTGYSLQLTQNQNWQHQLAGPVVVGHDILLGNDEVWGCESVSFEGYSVIHLARNTSRINWS